MSPTRSLQPTLSRAFSAVMFTSALIVIRAALAVPADSAGVGDRLLDSHVAVPSAVSAPAYPVASNL